MTMTTLTKIMMKLVVNTAVITTTMTMVMKTMTMVVADRPPYPEVVPGVAGVSRVVDEAVPSIVSLWQRDAQLGVDVLHELSAVVHRLEPRRREEGRLLACCLNSSCLSRKQKKSEDFRLDLLH